MITSTQRKEIEDRMTPGELIWRLTANGKLGLRQIYRITAREWQFCPPGGGEIGYFNRPTLRDVELRDDGLDVRGTRFWWHLATDVFDGDVPERIRAAAPRS